MKSIKNTSEMTLYLSDESKKTGSADRIFFPSSSEELRELIISDTNSPITLQGARTGVTAGAVPYGGTVINLSSMNRILSIPAADEVSDKHAVFSARVQPGILLCRLREELTKRHLIFQPDPTETTASIGGMVSCNSSGARSYMHGATRDHILGLEIILSDGDSISIRRGKVFAESGRFSITTDGGRSISGVLPEIRMPQVRKHTAGYYIRPDMDMIDLFIGSEGTLGIVSEIEISLEPAPAERWGTVVFFGSESCAVKFVELLRGNTESGSIYPEAIEFFGQDTVRMLRNTQLNAAALSDLPPIPSACAVYIEYTADTKDHLEELCHHLGSLISCAGGEPSDSWFALGGPDMQRFKDFRHAAPVCVNETISEIRKTVPSVTKLGTDMSVPDDCLEEVFRMYRSDLKREGFQSSLFGHIGNNHLHCNIMPRTEAEYERGKELYSHWADEVVRMGGSVSAEHGIGKLKPWLLQKLYTEKELQSMFELKKMFDPGLRLNPGNIFPETYIQKL